jgi:hypothetical protein
MKIVERYSHLNGWEYLQVHHLSLWDEIQEVIESVDAGSCKTKVSKEKSKLGQHLYDPKALNKSFKTLFAEKKWKEKRMNYWVTKSEKLIRRTLTLSEAKEQKKIIENAKEEAIQSYNQTDFSKERISVEVQFGKYAFVAYDLFVKHLAFYVRDQIDVGVEIIAMKSLQKQMSSGPGYYEGELYNVIRQGRGVPAVPLVLIGIEP